MGTGIYKVGAGVGGSASPKVRLSAKVQLGKLNLLEIHSAGVDSCPRPPLSLPHEPAGFCTSENEQVSWREMKLAVTHVDTELQLTASVLLQLSVKGSCTSAWSKRITCISGWIRDSTPQAVKNAWHANENGRP